MLAGSVWPKNGSKVRKYVPPGCGNAFTLGAEIIALGAEILPLSAEYLPLVRKCPPWVLESPPQGQKF